MKKILFFMACIALVFNSCDNYDISNPVDVNSFPKATVSGIVTAEFDAQLGETPVPEGTVLVFSIENQNYLSGAQGNHIITTTVGENGTYSVQIPVTTDGVTAYVTSSDFIATFRDNDNVTYEKIYSLERTPVNVYQNISVIENFSFDGEEIYDVDDENRIVPTMTSTLSGSLEYLYRTDDTGVDSHLPIPSESIIKVKITLTEYNDLTGGKYVENQTITVGSNGRYTITVPMIKDGEAKVELSGVEVLEYTQFTSPTDYTRKYYRYELEETVWVYEKDKTDEDFEYTRGASPLN